MVKVIMEKTKQLEEVQKRETPRKWAKIKRLDGDIAILLKKRFKVASKS